MTDSMPSNYAIFDYWKDKLLYDDILILDWGEPSCWCCNKPIMVETPELLRKSDYKTIWKKTSGHLQRCHIVPASLGGSSTTDNLFLMCSKCHSEAPNTDNRDAFLRWVLLKRRYRVFGYDMLDISRGIEDACRMYDINMDSFVSFIINFELSNLFCRISTHVTKITESSFVMILVEEYLDSLVTV